ncbi:MAG: YfhO family protein [Bacteroidota bacterium]|nr:YfhO family protein [Bacteroidota bacterium]
MNRINFKELLPHIIAITLFLLATLIYVNPVLSGKKVKQGDIVNYRGMSKEITDFRTETGEEPLWTNSMFSGMPAYQISMKYKSNLVKKIDKIFRMSLPRPADYIFLNFIGFYILLLVLGVNPWLSIVGAFAYTFSSYFFIILEAGHNTKAHAIAYMAPVIAGVLLTYKRKYILGGALTLLFVSLEIVTNHLQITYYLLYILIFIGIAEFVYNFRNKQLPHFFKATAILFAAAIIAIGPNITSLLLTQEYSTDTIRGKSELTSNNENKTSGLDKDYATQWSYGKQETLTLMIPNAKGGGSGYMGQSPESLTDTPQQYQQIIAQQNHYWGNQPFTSGPVYVGAIIFFLFILGLLILETRLKWALLAATLLSIFLSWGHNMMWFTDFFLDYIPIYNKFRTVSMTLVIAELCIPLLGILAVQRIIDNPEIISKKRKQFFIALGLTGGVSIILYLLPDTFLTFLSERELTAFASQKASNPQSAGQIDIFLDALETARINIFQKDTLRSLFFILVSGGSLYLFSIKKIKTPVLITLLGLFIVIDMWSIDKRYLNNDNFESARKVENPFSASRADKVILQDNDPNFRVYNLTVSPFNDASTSFFHKSIGGYHGAKLRRYQELIDHHITKNNPNVLNMLNTKYFIVPDNNRQPHAQYNPNALGHAWFVNNYRIVENADQEIEALNNFNADSTAVIDKRFKTFVDGVTISSTDNATITLKSYAPNKLIYSSNTTQEQLAVFSEIYYKNGWNAYIDGELQPHFRVNYVLRSMVIPKGTHTIEFKFEPQLYTTGENIALGTSILLILLVVGGLGFEVRKKFFS